MSAAAPPDPDPIADLAPTSAAKADDADIDRLASLTEAEALARIAMISAQSANETGPSKAVVGTIVGLAVLLVALVLLAIIVSVGPDPAATSIR